MTNAWPLRLALHGLLRRFTVLLFISLAATAARADGVLLLEEPVNFLGHISSTGHSALLMESLCSDDHLHLRSCHAGESGVVLSRYQGAAGYDWLAVDAAPYLYAAESAADVLPSATPADLTALRASYERRHAAEFPASLDEDDWAQLLGAAYRRHIICLRFKSTPAQDAALMDWLNDGANRSHFNFFLNNCADFTRKALNRIFPGSVHRNLLFDAGMTTPKQIAASLHHYAGRHPELQLQVEDIAQVSGSIARSGHLYGVTQSFVRTKPYLMPIAILQPVGMGAVIASGFADRRYDPHRADRTAPAFELGADALQPDTGIQVAVEGAPAAQ